MTSFPLVSTTFGQKQAYLPFEVTEDYHHPEINPERSDAIRSLEAKTKNFSGKPPEILLNRDRRYCPAQKYLEEFYHYFLQNTSSFCIFNDNSSILVLAHTGKLY